MRGGKETHQDRANFSHQLSEGEGRILIKEELGKLYNDLRVRVTCKDVSLLCLECRVSGTALANDVRTHQHRPDGGIVGDDSVVHNNELVIVIGGLGMTVSLARLTMGCPPII